MKYLEQPTNTNQLAVTTLPVRDTWIKMLREHHSKKSKVAKEWLIYTNFETWYNEHHFNGYVFTNKLISRNNKTYQPSKCSFVPVPVCKLLRSSRNKPRSNYRRKMDGYPAFNQYIDNLKQNEGKI